MDADLAKIEYQHFRIPAQFVVPRKSPPPEHLLFPYEPGRGFLKKGFPLEGRSTAKKNGGRTVCTITTVSGEVFTGVVSCSMSQKYLWDYGEDTALNRAKVAQGHECAYCRHIIHD